MVPRPTATHPPQKQQIPSHPVSATNHQNQGNAHTINMPTLKKLHPKTAFFLGHGTGGTIATIIYHTASTHVDAIQTSSLHPLLSILIWWITASLFAPLFPQLDQPESQNTTRRRPNPKYKNRHVP